jgi:tetratricopeptide (TPR) repeat protein
VRDEGPAPEPEDRITTTADLDRRLAADPAAATPRLALELKERVDELARTDARAARELAAVVVVVAERCGDARSAALAHRARGVAALASGRHRDSIAAYEAAERIYHDLGDELERARVLRSMVDPLAYFGRHDDALAAGHEAREIFVARGEKGLAAEVDVNLGNVHQRLDRNHESLEAYSRALAAFRELHDDAAVAVIEFNRGNVFANLGELSAARRSYRRALSHFGGRGQRLREAQCRYALAYLAFLQGRASAALRGFERVRRLDEELGDARHLALASLDEAEILLSLNAWEEARDRSADAGRALAELAMPHDEARAVLCGGIAAIHLRRPREATALLDDAGRRFAAEGNEVYLALVDVYRAELGLRRGEHGEAVRGARRAARAFAQRGLGAKEAYARVLAGDALAALGRPDAARREARRSLAALRRAPSAAVAARARHLLARVEPDPVLARRHLDRALELVARLRSRVVPDELRATFQRDKTALHELAARLRLESDVPDVPAAFAVVDAAKSRVLAEARSRAPLPGDAAWLRALERLDQRTARLAEAEREGREEAAAELRREVAMLEARLAEQHRSRHLVRGGPRLGDAPSRDLLPELHASLGPCEALVEYAFLDDELHAFVVSDGRIRWIERLAGRRDVDAAVSAWRFQSDRTALGAGFLERHGPALAAAAVAALERISRIVWKPLSSALRGIEEVVVVPSGSLLYVPFHALREDGGFLVERREVSTAPSAESLIDGYRQIRPEPRPPLVVGFAPPGLSGIDAEVASVQRHLPGARVLMGAEARRDALQRMAPEAGIVHIAAHAALRDDNPFLSWIELADGRFTVYDLLDTGLGADLVVLSGCETGRGRVEAGDELLGFAHGVLASGACALLASLWPVDDAATAAFMDRFYGALASAAGPRAALRQAMLGSLAEAALPHLWAPFYLCGRPR